MKYALGLFVVAAALAASHVNGESRPARPAVASPEAVATIQPLEVRVRKLHLVRPDLQRFPIPYDTVC